jgi:hypothetical protein
MTDVKSFITLDLGLSMLQSGVEDEVGFIVIGNRKIINNGVRSYNCKGCQMMSN